MSTNITTALNSSSMYGGIVTGWTSGKWSGLWRNTWLRVGRNSSGGSPTHVYATNILFDADELNALRGKSIVSIKLKVTVAEGNIYGPGTPSRVNNLGIGYKLTPESGENANGSSYHWTRSAGADKYVNAKTSYATDEEYEAAVTANAGTLQVAVLAESSGTGGSVTNKTYEIDVGTDLPKYGYVIGPENSGMTYYVTIASSAQLVVTYAEESHTVTYDKGTHGTGTNRTAEKTPGVALTLEGAIFAREGYTQTGWATSDGGAKAYDLSGSYSSEADITLYPVWTANTYTVTFNANGGTGAPNAQTKTYGVNLTLSSTVPTLSGKTFKGWAASAGATVPAFQAGGTYTDDASITLYAVWQDSVVMRQTVLYVKVRGSMIPTNLGGAS